MALLLFFGLSPGTAGAAPAGAEKSVTACSDCHDQAKTFASNPHARGKAPKGEVSNAACTPCHGDGTLHMDAGGDKEKIYKPVGRCGAETCVACHDQTKGCKSMHSGKHANSETVNCLSCHSIHGSELTAPSLLAKKQLELCGSCHSSQVAVFRNKPYGHRIGRGGMECSTCHEPHQSTNAGCEITKQTISGESICVSCHADKKGPFVFPHGAGSIGNCMTCHEPHASNNMHRLKRATVSQLCMECHSPIKGGTFGSQPPSFHNLLTARYQNCTTCHTAIHGSNRSPQLVK
jgi:DmsE family decaheme c-type cytochrome